jgi:type VI secretion system ImpM family protein
VAWNLFSRLVDGLSSSGGNHSEQCPLQLYGKLPIYKDFISSGVGDEGAKEFREWVGNGYSKKWAVSEECRGVEIPPHTFVLPLPGSRRTVAGCLWGSHDEGGLRSFPFAAFAVLQPGRRVSDPTTALSYLEVYHERSVSIRRNFNGGRTVSSFYESYRGARVELPVVSAEALAKGLSDDIQNVTVEEFASALLGEDAVARWPGHLDALEKAVRQNVSGGAVRIPLGPILPKEMQVQVWLAWLRSRAALSTGALRGVLVERSEERGRAVLLFRDLKADDFLLLHPGRSDYDWVEEVDTEVSAGGSVQEVAGALPSGWDEPLAALFSGGRGN